MKKLGRQVAAGLLTVLFCAGALYGGASIALSARMKDEREQAMAAAYGGGDYLSAEERIMGLSLIWREATRFYAYFEEVPELDWDAAYQAAIPKVLAAETLADYYDELRAFHALLGDGHGGVVSRTVQTARGLRGTLPVRFLWVEGQALARYVSRDLSGVIPPGSVVTEIEDQPVEDYLEARFGAYVPLRTPYARQQKLLEELYNGAAAGEAVTLAGTTPEGASFRESVTYALDPSPGERLPDDTGHAEGRTVTRTWTSYESFSAYRLSSGVYVAQLPSFSSEKLPAEFRQWMDVVGAEAEAFILDARGNSGGNATYGLSVLSHFAPLGELNGTVSSVQYTDPLVASAAALMDLGPQWGLDYLEEDPQFSTPAMESYLEVGRAMLAGRNLTGIDVLAPVYEALLQEHGIPEALQGKEVQEGFYADRLCDQPVVVLTDWQAGSAGEDFAAFVKGRERFTLLGTHTHGTTGQLILIALPGDMAASFSIKNDKLPDGTPIFGRGVQPDIWSERTVAGVRAGVDTILTDALDYLGK